MSAYYTLLLISFYGINSVLLQEYNECAQGPKLWCNSLQYAQKCGAVNHCAQLWINQKDIIKSDNQDCQFCLFLINNVKQMIENSDAEGKIKNEIVASCSILNNQDTQKKCLALQNEMYFTMGVLLKKQISPFWICNGIQMCNSSIELQQFQTTDEIYHSNPLESNDPNKESIIINKEELIGNDEANFQENHLKGDPQILEGSDSTQLINNLQTLSNFSSIINESLIIDLLYDFNKNMLQSGLQEENLCDMCQKGVKSLDILLQSPDFQRDLLKYAAQFCKDLPDFKDNFMCQEGLKKFLPDLIKIIDAKLKTTDVCVKAQVCSPKTLLLLKNRANPSANLCGDCKNLVGQVKDFLDKTEPKILDAAKHFCQSFPQRIQEKCTSMVKDYIPSIYEYLNMIMDPVQMCQAFGICALGENKPIAEMKMTEAVQMAQNFLLQGVPLFSKISDAGKTLERQKEESKLAQTSLDVKVSQFAKGQEPNSFECEVCKLVTKALLKELGENKSVENIKFQLDRVCNILPSNWSKDCKYFVNTYTDTLVILLENNSNATEICQYFDFCQVPDNPTSSFTMLSSSLRIPLFSKISDAGKTLETQKEESKLAQISRYMSINSLGVSKDVKVSQFAKGQEPNSFECEVCKLVTKALLKELGENKSVENIKFQLDRVCNILPSNWSKECKYFVSTYTDTLLILLENNSNATEICQYFDFCQVPDNPTSSFTMLSSPTQQFNYCPLCHIVVNLISKEIGKNASDEKLLEWGKKFCATLPAVWAQECDDYLDAYGLQALRIISDSMDPDVVCQQLGMCQMKRVDILYNAPRSVRASNDRQEGSHKLLGGHHCTRGPGYWCLSAEKAESCGATEYCKSNGGFKQ